MENKPNNRNKRLLSIAAIAAVLLFAGLLFFTPDFNCGWKKNVYTKKTDTTRILVYDSVEVRYTTPSSHPNAPKLVYVDSTRIDTVYIRDTAQLVRDWQTNAYYYRQELRDSLYSLIVQDTIYQNKITWRDFAIKRIKPLEQMIITNTITEQAEPQRAFYIHAQAHLGASVGFSPGIIYQSKKQTLYSLHTNIMQQPSISIGVGVKLGKK